VLVNRARFFKEFPNVYSLLVILPDIMKYNPLAHSQLSSWARKRINRKKKIDNSHILSLPAWYTQPSRNAAKVPLLMPVFPML
jgi:hypothetical protein